MATTPLIRLTASSSPITTQVVALSGVSFSEFKPFGSNGVAFACRDPSNAGKSCVKTLTVGSTEPVLRTPITANVRSAVHEYGGGAFCVGPKGEGIIYTDFPSHVVYWSKHADEEPLQIHPPIGTTSSPLRFADFHVITQTEDAAVPLLVAVMEDHTDPAPANVQNSIVTLSLDGKGTVTKLASGHDFYAAPQISNNNNNNNVLAFVAWDHPNMPWDATRLYVQPLTSDYQLEGEPMAVHGGGEDGVSVQDPRWWKDQETLLFLSNVSGWYNLYSYKNGNITPLYPKEADFSDSHQGWMLGLSPYAICPDGRIVTCYAPTSDDDGAEPGARLVQIELQADGTVSKSAEFGRAVLPPTGMEQFCPTADGSAIYFHGGSVTEPAAIWCWEQGSTAQNVLSSMNDFESLKPTLEPFMSTPRKIRFPSDGGVGYAYGYYYPPTNLSEEAKQQNILPPLLVKAHGGPTARTSASFRLGLQFWTSRGFAFLDVDYGGSTGYGKDYVQSLRGKWGIVDVADVCNGAKYCVEQGWVNSKWLCIDGGSAGGYTTLAALTFTNVMAAGASLYGVADLSALAADTHKFESRYLDGLVGPYPEEKALYDERCPLNFTDQLNCPVLLLQGDEDKIVPPNQAEVMFDALMAKGIPSTLVMYKGEQHGFRKASNIQHALNSEYHFFCQVFGIEPQLEEGFAGIRMGERLDIE